jgi:hypothetical protein
LQNLIQRLAVSLLVQKIEIVPKAVGVEKQGLRAIRRRQVGAYVESTLSLLRLPDVSDPGEQPLSWLPVNVSFDDYVQTWVDVRRREPSEPILRPEEPAEE